MGGSVPVFDEVVLNLQGMNKIRGFDSVSGKNQKLMHGKRKDGRGGQVTK